jgi:hypothetical protein
MILRAMERKSLVVELAKSDEEIREARPLRHLVFSQEYGASVSPHGITSSTAPIC